MATIILHYTRLPCWFFFVINKNRIPFGLFDDVWIFHLSHSNLSSLELHAQQIFEYKITKFLQCNRHFFYADFEEEETSIFFHDFLNYHIRTYIHTYILPSFLPKLIVKSNSQNDRSKNHLQLLPRSPSSVQQEEERGGGDFDRQTRKTKGRKFQWTLIERPGREDGWPAADINRAN